MAKRVFRKGPGMKGKTISKIRGELCQFLYVVALGVWKGREGDTPYRKAKASSESGIFFRLEV